MKVLMYATLFLKFLLRPLPAASESCPAQQYSGRFQAKYFKADKAIFGHSYKNLTVKAAQECFSHCVSDCKCMSYQIFGGTRCELLDENKNTAILKPASGYQFYRLIQSLKDGVSCVGGCRNGCCHSNPCMNGGTCVETCKNAEQKFKCICPLGTQGKYCQFIVSCTGIPEKPKSGIHTITRPSLTSQLKVYCDFTSEPNFVWTLVESFEYSKKPDYLTRKFYENYPVNEANPNWVDYRLSLEDMTHIRTNATHWRVTCNIDSANISTSDYVRVNMNTLDVMQSVASACFKVGFLRLHGKTCTANCDTRLETKRYHPYFSPCHSAASPVCKFEGCPINQENYEAFGSYDALSLQHDCSSSSTSTTNYWFGYKRK